MMGSAVKEPRLAWPAEITVTRLPERTTSWLIQTVLASVLAYIGAIPLGLAIASALKVDVGIYFFGFIASVPVATALVLWWAGSRTGRFGVLRLLLALAVGLVVTAGTALLFFGSCLLLSAPVLGTGLAILVYHACSAGSKPGEGEGHGNDQNETHESADKDGA
jgi:hypothetical protein